MGLAARSSNALQPEGRMPDEPRSQGITEHEHAERRHNAEVTPPAPATGDHQSELPEDATEQDRIARATGAIGPDTVTDPVELMMQDNRPGQGGGRNS